MHLSLPQADALIDEVLAEARGRCAKPLAVVVVDAGGHPIACKREDGATFFRFDIALAKAKGSVGLGTDTGEIAARAVANPVFFATAAIATHGGLVVSAGGVLIRGTDGEVLGGIGVSGDAADVDEACALAGIEAAGLQHVGGGA